MRSTPSDASSSTALQKLQNASEQLVADLRGGFAKQLEHALGVGLDNSVISLAYVDHYLAQARDETREPILTLLAAGAGAYFGDLVCRTIGGSWLGDGKRATSLRVLLHPQMIYFSPFAIALDAILGESIGPGDPRAPADAPHDASFLFATPPRSGDANSPDQDDTAWLKEVLTNLAPVPEHHFHSLTCRFETIELMLQLLAERQASRGCTPQTYTIADYVAAFDRPTGDAPS
ncbi:MAG TPA: hypothetical protein ENJ18_04970 [Nannocystis exedens]|nr:hypothetical protein [Nannocystis exedens]